MGKDYYNILGVDKGSSADEIKKAFRKKAHEHHPDKEHGDEVKFKEVNEAYQVLSDEHKKAQYDQFGQNFNGAGQQYSNMNWDDFMGNFGDIFRGGTSQNTGGFGDIFSEMFTGDGGNTRQESRNRGRDLEASLRITLSEAVFGIEKEIKLESAVFCKHCSGNGAEPGTKINSCPECQGRGHVERVHRTILGNIMQQAECSTCQGRGKKPEKFCKKCHGEGRVNEKRVIKIKVPAGIASGQTVRLQDQGEAGKMGSGTGDLYVNIVVELDNRFDRVGDDLHMQREISFSQAALGGSISVDTLDGEVKLKIPSGTQPGQVIRLRDKGVTHLQGSGRGDILVGIRVQVPQKLSKKQKKILEDLDL